MIKTLKAIALIFLFASPVLAQQVNITGRVTSTEDSLGLPGVNVVIKGTTTGTVTDFGGKYSINAAPDATIVYSYLGFIAQEVKVVNAGEINIVLKPNIKMLNEVIVTGYSVQQKRDVVGSIVSISSENFKDMPVASMDQALQGQAAGVQVTQSSGTPGGGIKVAIRGSTSISASNRPLFIVDGVPVEDGGLSGISFGGQADNAFSSLNPNDIESIQVLKDASEKAMYGSRAANGVVIITTKRGKNNTRTKFNFETQRGVVDITHKVELLNSTELLTLQREAVTNAGKDPGEFGLVEGVTDAINTNWLDEVLRKGIFQQYQLSANGGGDKTSFYLSGNYRDEEGVQLNNEFERYSGTLNVDHKATDRLTIGNNLTISRTINKRVKNDNYLDGAYSAALQTLPYYTPYDEFGNLIGYGASGFPRLNGNPVGNAVFPRYLTYATKVLGGLYARYRISEELNFKTQISVDYNNVIDDQFQSTQTIIGGNPDFAGGKGYGINASATFATVISSNVLTYSKRIGDHNISGLLGGEILQRVERSNSVSGRLFPSDDFTYITSAGIVDNGSSGLVKNGLESIFGEIKYDYKDKYLLKIGSRIDGSSRFGSGKKFGVFPSFGAKWRISSEPFLKDQNLMNDLSFRASYGFTGNEGIGEFEYLGRWTARTYDGLSGVGPSRIDNTQLHWEGNREINLGLDVALLNSRINVTLDLYHKRTNDLLFDRPLSYTTGLPSIKGNIGNISNKGIEFAINTVNIDRKVKWSTNINLSRNINNVDYLVDTIPLNRGYEANGANSTSVIRQGRPLGTFSGLKYLGVDPATGDAIYDDVNGDGTITADDATEIGSAQPKLIGAITNRFSYMGFDLSIFFQFSYGNDVLNFSKSSLLNAGEDINTNQSIEALKRWQKPGDITYVPRYEYGNTYNNRHSSRFIEDGSYLRLKNLTMGYNIPLKYVSKIRVSNARVYMSGTNLLTFTKYTGGDPEVSTLDGSTSAQGTDLFTFPQVRTLMIGVTVGF